MIPVNNSPALRFGDCFSACISAMLEKPVPHILHDGCDGYEKLTRIDSYLMSFGLSYIEIPVSEDSPLEARIWGESLTGHSGQHYLLLGTTETGSGHYVVCRGKLQVHNPNPGAEIVAPFPDGIFWLGFITHRS